MYFLRWLYREVNPMMLILGLVTLYFLLNLATCSNSTDSVTSVTTTHKTDTVERKSVAKPEVVDKVDDTVVRVDKKATEMTNADGAHVESALSKVFKDKQVSKELNADVTIEDEQAASKPSVLNRVFKKSTEQMVADTSKVDSVTETVVEEVVDATKKSAAVVSGAVVAAAGAVSAAVSEDELEIVVEAEPKIETDAVILTEEEAIEAEPHIEVEVVTEAADEVDKKGGFFGIFNRSTDTDTEKEVEIETVIELEDTVVDAQEELDTVSTEPEISTEVVDNSETVAVTEVVETEPEEATVHAVDPVPAPPSYSANVSADQAGLSAARRAFWDRDYSTADTLYSEMIAKEASNAELIAEYGNMLLQSGQVEKTLDAYEIAASLMIDDGRKQQAKPLIDYISSWDQGRADALINKVFAQ